MSRPRSSRRLGAIPEAASLSADAVGRRLPRRAPTRVTFDHPPINTITETTVAEFSELVGLIEQDPDLGVVVFDSANPDFYLAHCNTEHDPGRTAALEVGPTGMNASLDLLVRLSRAPVVSIASIRGRAYGAGSEIVGDVLRDTFDTSPPWGCVVHTLGVRFSLQGSLIAVRRGLDTDLGRFRGELEETGRSGVVGISGYFRANGRSADP